jgi:hypothetical protein
MPTAMYDPTPEWLKPENASVLDSQLVKVLRAIVNANPWPKPLQGVLPNPNPAAMVADPQSQVLAVMGADVPSGGPIKAFHASPYDFEKFDSSKIGTGQGAATFGHGHYSAQMEPTAESYLSLATPEVKVGGTPLPMPKWSQTMSPEARLIRRIGDHRMINRTAPEAEILAQVKDDLTHQAKARWRGDNDQVVTEAKEQLRLLAEWEQQGIASQHGHMYEIAINADPAHLLDWDKPLSEQSEHVQAAVNKIRNRQRSEFGLTWKETPIQALDLGDYATEHWGRQYRSEVIDPKTKKAIATFQGGSPEEVTAKIAQWRMAREDEFLAQTGKEFYHARADAADIKSRGSMTYVDRKKAASTQLREAGVPGIKYLDQESRQVGQGTYNYVITDDKLIDILRKFGMLLPAVGAANYGALAKQIVPPGEEAK